MKYYRYDGNILDFTRGPITDKLIKMVDNCFIKERQDRITLYRLKLTMACPGEYLKGRKLDFYLKLNQKRSELTCGRCHFALLGAGKLCTVNSFLLPRIFHHKKANFDVLMALLEVKGYLQAPVPDPMTWSYLTFRY